MHQAYTDLIAEADSFVWGASYPSPGKKSMNRSFTSSNIILPHVAQDGDPGSSSTITLGITRTSTTPAHPLRCSANGRTGGNTNRPGNNDFKFFTILQFQKHYLTILESLADRE